MTNALTRATSRDTEIDLMSPIQLPLARAPSPRGHLFALL